MQPKHEKRECKCVRTHEAWHPHSLCPAVLILDVPSPLPSSTSCQLRTILIDGPFQPKKHLRHSNI